MLNATYFLVFLFLCLHSPPPILPYIKASFCNLIVCLFHFLIIFVLLFVFLALFFCFLLFPFTISATSNKEIAFFIPSSLLKTRSKEKNINCGQLLLLRITQPLPWWLPFWGNQTLIQMPGSESWLLSFYINKM